MNDSTLPGEFKASTLTGAKAAKAAKAARVVGLASFGEAAESAESAETAKAFFLALSAARLGGLSRN